MAVTQVDQILVNGLKQLESTLDEVKHKTDQASEEPKQQVVLLFFVGDPLPESGDSWCPDCVAAAGPVKDLVAKLQDPAGKLSAVTSKYSFVLMTIQVGDRPTWKDPENEFRKSDYALKSIPTLLVPGTVSVTSPLLHHNPGQLTDHFFFKIQNLRLEDECAQPDQLDQLILNLDEAHCS